MPDLYEISGMKLDEISLCRSGDNVGAKVVLAKSDPDEHDYREEIDTADDSLSDDEVALLDATDGEVTKVPSSAYPDLERKKGPGNDNWVEAAGGLPSYVERIAKHLHYERGMSISHAIASAVNKVKKWAAGGEGVSAATRAKAAKAVAEWEAKKAKARVTKTEWVYTDLEKGEHHAFTNENAKKPGKDVCDKCGRKAKAHDVKRVRKSFGQAISEFLFGGDEADVVKSQENSPGSDTLDNNPQQEDVQVPKTTDGKLPEIKKDDLPAEVVTYIDTLESRFETMEQELAGLKAGTGSQVAKSDEDAEKEALAKADPALRRIIEKAQREAEEAKANAEAAGKVAKAEADARIEREMLSKAEALPMLSEDKSELASVLRAITENLDPTVVEKLETILKSANEQIAEGNLFSTLARPGQQTTVSKSVEGKAAELRKNDPKLTQEQAIALVYEQNPDLYDAELKEA